MQYKGLLFAIVIATPLSSLFAQRQTDQGFTLGGNNTRVIRKDSIITKSTPVAVPAAPLVLAPPAPTALKPVPLAGEQSYFGSMNGFVEEFTKQYMQRNNKTLSVVKTRGDGQFSLMEGVLQQHNIPKELKYLAVIESALNNNAISRAGAVGPWQLMESTARLMGLTVNRKRDDRKDVEKSTGAAARYLSYLYGELNDWLLVVAAYNSGPTPVQKAIAKTGSTNFWDIKQYLPKETQGHVMAFIATASIFENMSKFIGGSLPNDFAFTKEAATAAEVKKPTVVKSLFSEEELKQMSIVRINEPLSLELLAQELKIEKRLLERWNPDYDAFYYTGNHETEYYSLRIPKEKLDNFIERRDYLYKRSKQLYADLRF